MKPKANPLLRPLLLMQTGLLLVNALEATLFAAVGFATPVPALLTWAAVVVIGDAARRRHAPRRIRVIQWILIVFGVIDMGISVFAAGQILEPMALLSRFLVPATVLRMTRKRKVDPESGPVESELVGVA